MSSSSFDVTTGLYGPGMSISSRHTILLPTPTGPVTPDTTVPVARSIAVCYSPEPRGYWMTTKGLGIWGLPELQTLHVHGEVVEPWCWVMTGIGLSLTDRWMRLLADDPPAFVEVPATVEVTGQLVDRAYGEQFAIGRGTAVVQLTLDPATHPDDDSFLTLGPPDDFVGSRRDFMLEACTSLFEPPAGLRGERRR
jgi:hypothetical protein